MGKRAPGIGILAGGGSLPGEIADRIVAGGRRVHIVALEGEADRDFRPHPVTTANWGQIGRMVRAFRANDCPEIVIVGRATRPDLKRIRPDLGFFLNLPQIIKIMRAGGDDGVLSRVVRFFESKGLRVVGPVDVVPELLIGAGAFAGPALAAEAEADARLGFEVVRQLGAFDIGQAVIVANGRVEAIEGAEGTDGMLTRVADQRRKAGVNAVVSSVLVKRPKPGQDLRVDLPAIGPETVRRAAAAGLSAIVVEANAVLAAEAATLKARATEQAVTVTGLGHDTGSMPPRKISGNVRDEARGRAVIAALSTLCPAGAVAVSGRHVLAVETGEGVDAMIARVAAVRPWGRDTSRPRGVIVLSRELAAEPSLVDAAARAGFKLVGTSDVGEGRS